MFKVSNKNTRTRSLTPFSSVSIVDFEQVDVNWEGLTSFVGEPFCKTIHHHHLS